MTSLPFEKRQLWLTSFWGFDPDLWGGAGFTKEHDRARFLREAGDGALLAIYVTKHKGPEEQRGKLVGFMEMTAQVGPMQSFTSPTEWAAAERDAGRKGKWVFGVRASRAWEIVEEDWQRIESIFPETYAGHNKQQIGARSVAISIGERANVADLTVRELSVYGQDGSDSEYLQPLSQALSPSKGVTPSTVPHMVKEADGPKYLYILRLEGDYSAYLGRSNSEVSDKHIIKVGFSKSPLNRRRQIQNAYPRGKFNWVVAKQHPKVGCEAYPNALIALAGEDAMKKRIVEEGGECLGGEFFFVSDNIFERAISVGKFVADQKLAKLVSND